MPIAVVNLDAMLDVSVPPTDSVVNADFVDVIGSKLDSLAAGGNSLYALAHTLEEHLHSSQIVRPNLAASVQVQTNVAAWTYGVASADLVPAAGPGSMAVPFDIHGVAIDTISANGQFQLAIVQTVGGVDTTICEVSFVRTNALTSSLHIPVQTPLIPAGAQITALLACAAGGAETCGLKLRMHGYP